MENLLDIIDLILIFLYIITVIAFLIVYLYSIHKDKIIIKRALESSISNFNLSMPSKQDTEIFTKKADDFIDYFRLKK